jgi:intraflagellar transport protein 88
MMSFAETSRLLQSELLQNDYSYNVEGIAGMNSSQYDFGHVQSQPPPSAYMQRTAAAGGGGRMSAMPSSRGGFGRNTETARPMTSNRAAGYTAANKNGNKLFDPLNQGDGKGAMAKPLEKAELSQEEKLREMEKEIHRLVEQSAITREEGNLREALEKAKEAGKKERQLCRLREQMNLLDQLNADLTYAVCLNLAIQHQANDNDNEALTIYTQIVKNKQYPFSGRFRVNMGNISFKREKWTEAIKMYRMALDQIPNDVQAIRFKIMRNIGHAFFKMHQFTDAIDSYESLLMHGAPHLDFMTGFNLVLCYYALGDKDKMKSGFLKLLNIEQVGLEDFEDDEMDLLDSPAAKGNDQRQLVEGEDDLRKDIKQRQRDAARFIVNAANLISPTVDKTPVLGYDWTIDQLNHHGFPRIASELEIAKASYYLRRKEFDQAITVLKKFERKEPSLMACAATNLSFLYFLEADHASAEKYADIAVKADRYNARALVNKGNCMFMNDEFEHAKEIYLEAIGVSADCLEAIFNLGLVNMHTGKYQEALLAFDKLHSITRASCEVMWQLGDINEKLGNHDKAHEWFSLLVTSPKGRPTDPGVLARLANLFSQQGDEMQAFHYHLEAYRYWPVDMNVITWLGIYYVKQEMYEAAIPFFSRASQIEPSEVKWRLMVASCYRRMGAYPAALKLYEEIHRSHPNDIECVRYLITICKEMKLPYDNYAANLRKLEKQNEAATMNAPRPLGTVSALVDSQPEATPEPAFGGLVQQNRTGGFGALGRLDREVDSVLDTNPSRPVELYEAEDPDLPSNKGKRRIMERRMDDEDEWGGDELNDDLLPM